MELNSEEELNLKYICVQLPESIDSNHAAYKLGYRIIPELTKERLRRVSKSLNGVNNSTDDVGLGFKVYSLAKSNFNIHKPYNGANVAQLSLGFQQITDKPLVDNWAKPELTTELLLIEGFPLHSTQTLQPQYTENEVVAITSDFNQNTLYLCLDAQLLDETVDALAIGKEDVFICLDSALTDLQKIRLDDKLHLKTV